MVNIIDTLRERGLLEALTSEELREVTNRPIRVYSGFDPTADSLHLGNMVPIMGLAWFQRLGHTPVAILGGATGMIGDPSGRNTDRQFLTEETLAKNILGIQKNLATILHFDHPESSALLMNNYEWYKDVSFIRFLREIGSLFRVGPMLAKDSVRARLQSDEGMSFTEFSYQVLQGFDFLHLFQHHGVSVQIGGSDQWGNITAGTDLIRKVEGKAAYGITLPLLVSSTGQKFGKSEKGAIWLSPDKLSSYEFYQYLVRVEDADVCKLMRMLTFMDMEEIKRYEKQMSEPGYLPRTAQKKLAEEVTNLVHGKEGLQIAMRVTEGISPGSTTVLDANVLEAISSDMPCFHISLNNILHCKLIDLLVEVGLQTSKSEARRLIRNGGVYINNNKIEDENCTITDKLLIDNQLMLIATGKKNKMLVRINEN